MHDCQNNCTDLENKYHKIRTDMSELWQKNDNWWQNDDDKWCHYDSYDMIKTIQKWWNKEKQKNTTNSRIRALDTTWYDPW